MFPSKINYIVWVSFWISKGFRGVPVLQISGLSLTGMLSNVPHREYKNTPPKSKKKRTLIQQKNTPI